MLCLVDVFTDYLLVTFLFLGYLGLFIGLLDLLVLIYWFIIFFICIFLVLVLFWVGFFGPGQRGCNTPEVNKCMSIIVLFIDLLVGV